MPLMVKQNFTNEDMVLCFACKHYAVLSFAPGMDELSTCDLHANIDPELLTGEKKECPDFEPVD